MFVGMTARGWGSTGGDLFGLQRLVWNGKMPFEILAIRAMPDGFELEFTKPVDAVTAKDVASYKIKTFLYEYHHEYGSPVINQGEGDIKAIEVSSDKMKVRLVIDGMKEGYIHEVDVNGIRSAIENVPLLHDIGYYTLNEIPDGQKLTITAANRVEIAGRNEITQSKAQTEKSVISAKPEKKAEELVNTDAKAMTYSKYSLYWKNTPVLPVIT